MRIVITIDERGNPKVELVKEESAPANGGATVEEVKEIAGELMEHKEEEVTKEVTPVSKTEATDVFTYERCESLAKLLPVYVHTWTGAYQIWKFLKKAGLVRTKQEFVDCYNAGWICIGQRNRYEEINDNGLDLSLFFGDIVWNANQGIGYLPIRYKKTNILVRIIRIHRGRTFYGR